jgi:hypothetical protein
MSNHNDNRVLGRMGARQLTENEVDEVTGGSSGLMTLILTGSIKNPDRHVD